MSSCSVFVFRLDLSSWFLRFTLDIQFHVNVPPSKRLIVSEIRSQ